MYEMQIIDNAGKCDYCNSSAAFRFTHCSGYNGETASYRTCELCSILFTGDAATVAACSQILIRARVIDRELQEEFEASRRRLVDSLTPVEVGAGAFGFALREMLEAHPLPSLLQ